MTRRALYGLTLCCALMLGACSRLYFVAGPNNGQFQVFKVAPTGGPAQLVIAMNNVPNTPFVIDSTRGWLLTGIDPSSKPGIYRMTLTGADMRLICASPEPRGIAIDEVNHRVYWIDVKNGTINRCSVDGGNQSVLASPGALNAIAFDSTEGALYWWSSSPNGDTIVRADSDGKNPQVVLQQNVGVSPLAVDGGTRQAFYFDGQATKPGIVRANFNTEVRTTVVELDGRMVDSLINDSGHRILYWIDHNTLPPRQPRIVRANYDGSDLRVIYEYPGEAFGNAIALKR